MRNFEFDKSADIVAANNLGAQSTELPADTLRLDEQDREAVREDALSTFHSKSDDDDESDNNTAKIAGAVLVGLLLVGGSIYAYESTTANRASQTAAIAPVHQTVAAAQPVTPPVTTPDVSAPPAISTPASVSKPRPARSARANLATAPAASVASQGNSASATSTASADPAVNQPMTLSPQTAPPPQQSAMQQPITAPNVSGQTSQPTPEVANNNTSSSVPMPSATIQPNLTPTQPDVSAPTTPAPAGSNPATPAAPAPAPVQ